MWEFDNFELDDLYLIRFHLTELDEKYDIHMGGDMRAELHAEINRREGKLGFRDFIKPEDGQLIQIRKPDDIIKVHKALADIFGDR